MTHDIQGSVSARSPEHVAVLAAHDAELAEAPVLCPLAVAVLAHLGADVAPLLVTRVARAAVKVVFNTNPIIQDATYFSSDIAL